MAFVDIEALATLPLFKDLTPTELTWVGQALEARAYPKGREIIRMGQQGAEVYIVLSGAVKVFIRRPTGHQILLAISGRGEILGELSALDGQAASAGVVTLEPTFCLCLEKASFNALVHSLPALSYNLVQLLACRLRRVTAQAEALATLDVAGRVAHQLLFLSREYGCPSAEGILIPLRLTQSDVASLTGASREKVNRILHRFRDHHYITLNSEHYILVRNVKALCGLCR